MGSATTLAQFKRKLEEIKGMMRILSHQPNPISEYNRGLYNGLEHALAVFEHRDPRLMPEPAQDQEKK